MVMIQQMNPGGTQTAAKGNQVFGNRAESIRLPQSRVSIENVEGDSPAALAEGAPE
jgi:hypothetical protein